MVLASLLWLLSRINSDRVAHQVANNDSMLEWMVLPMFPCYAHFVTYFGNRFDPLPIHIHKQSKGRHCSLLVPSQSSGRNFYPSHGRVWSWLWVIVIKWADRPGPPPPARPQPALIMANIWSSHHSDAEQPLLVAVPAVLERPIFKIVEHN